MEKRSRYYYKGNLYKQLRAFCTAARHGSISEAAEELFLSQPAVSLQVQALERELDSVLFERRGPSIRLTKEGETLFEMARPLVEGMETLADRFAQHQRGELSSGEINIAAGESTIMYVLPQLMRRFRERYPDIHVHFHNVTGRDGLAMLREDKVDFAVGSMLDIPNDISYQPVYSYAPMLIMPQGHALCEKSSVTLEELSPYGLILPPRRLTTWRLVDMVFQRHHVDYKVALEVGGWEVIKRYVELGFGISIVTSICLREDDALESRDMSNYFPERTYGLVQRRGKYPTPQSRAFISIMMEDLDNRRWSGTAESQR
ncbi:MAG: LysR family transcriptional regulator [Wenzhouxiangellaceae bacterium]